MKKTRISLMLVCIFILSAMMLNLTGCLVTDRKTEDPATTDLVTGNPATGDPMTGDHATGNPVTGSSVTQDPVSIEMDAQDLMKGIAPNRVNASSDLTSRNAAVTDFAVRLFKASEQSGENTLISPLSVLFALSMTANGAQGETLEQMESVLGMSKDELNLYLYSYMNKLPQNEKYKLSLANSIWFTDNPRFAVNRSFLQTNADYYKADIYKAPFNNQTLKDINNWVNWKTDEMIPEMLEEISSDTVMCLINALAFDAEWSKIYNEYNVEKGEFTKEDGTKQDVEFMYGAEGIYLKDDKASGFMKYYSGHKYAFVAMLPDEGISLSDYVASLDGGALNAMLSNPKSAIVSSSIPKFETEYAIEMKKILTEMGMPLAFDQDNAQLGGLGSFGDENLSISRVIHKTFISVAEKGTKAGAATVVDIVFGGGADIPEDLEFKEVYLDRPFVYMLVDCENNIPFFIGTITDVGK